MAKKLEAKEELRVELGDDLKQRSKQSFELVRAHVDLVY